MAYGDGAVFREEERYAKEHKDLPVSVYLGAGCSTASTLARRRRFTLLS
jgi:hypothetical protein